MSHRTIARRHHLAERRRRWMAKVDALIGAPAPATITACRRIWRSRKLQRATHQGTA